MSILPIPGTALAAEVRSELLQIFNKMLTSRIIPFSLLFSFLFSFWLLSCCVEQEEEEGVEGEEKDKEEDKDEEEGEEVVGVFDFEYSGKVDSLIAVA